MKITFIKVVLFGFLIGYCTFVRAQEKKSNQTRLTGTYTIDRYVPDSLILYIQSEVFNWSMPLPILANVEKTMTTKVVNKSFVFNILNIQGIKYFVLKNANPIYSGNILEGFLEPGDQIDLKLDQFIKQPEFFNDSGLFKDTIKRVTDGIFNIKFTGKGSSKCQFSHNEFVRSYQYYDSLSKRSPMQIAVNSQLISKKYRIPFENLNLNFSNSEEILDLLKKTNQEFKGELERLERFRASLSSSAYQFIRIKLYSIKRTIVYRRFRSALFHRFLKSPLSDSDKSILLAEDKKFYKLYRDSLFNSKIASEEISLECPEYLYLLYQKAATDALYNVDSRDPYSVLKKSYSGKLRDYAIAYYFKNYLRSIENRDSLLSDALNLVKDENCLFVLKEVRNNSKGVFAYPFALKDTNDKIVKLSDFHGKVVFMDFWYTGCGACSGFYKQVLKPMEEKYRDNPNIVFVTVSIDKLKPFWLKSIENGEYTNSSTVSNVINLYTGGIGAAHEIIKHYSIQSYPRPLLIGRDGRILCADVNALRDPGGLEKQIELALR